MDIVKVRSLFLVFMLFPTTLGYFTQSGLVAYLPALITALIFLSLNTKQLFFNEKKLNDFLPLMVWLPFTLYAAAVFLVGKDVDYFSPKLLWILLLPVMSLAVYQIYKEKNTSSVSLIYKIILVFLILEMIICLGQISLYMFGVGLPVSGGYFHRNMVNGTFTNPNDLATLVLLTVFLVIGMEESFFGKLKPVFWFIAFFIIVVTSSRATLVLATILFLVGHKWNKKQTIVLIVLFLLILLVLYIVFSIFDNVVIDRVSERFLSIASVFESGVMSDTSFSNRFNSYMHFLNNFSQLGLGTMQMSDYFAFSEGANFGEMENLFVSPHSLIVEIGYWLGWPGLVLFFAPVVYMLRFSSRRIMLLLTLAIATSIPSGIIGYMAIQLLIFLCFYKFKGREANN